jgi:hypothetical protein
MPFCKSNQCIILSVLVTLIPFTIISFPFGEDRYAYSQSNDTNTSSNKTGAGVNLIDIHPSPLHLKSGSKFQIIATVVNDSPGDKFHCRGM